jgi:hypothetical protein
VVLGLLLGFLLCFAFFFTANNDVIASLFESIPFALIAGANRPVHVVESQSLTTSYLGGLWTDPHRGRFRFTSGAAWDRNPQPDQMSVRKLKGEHFSCLLDMVIYFAT